VKTKISDLQVGQRVWWFSQYGELMGADKGCVISELKPNHLECGTTYDEVTLEIEEIQEYDFDSIKVKENKENGCSQYKLVNKRRVDKPVIRRYGICAKQTMIYTSKPKVELYVDERVQFESECPVDGCGGVVVGAGWEDDGVIQKFDYQECKKCGWNQAS